MTTPEEQAQAATQTIPAKETTQEAPVLELAKPATIGAGDIDLDKLSYEQLNDLVAGKPVEVPLKDRTEASEEQPVAPVASEEKTEAAPEQVEKTATGEEEVISEEPVTTQPVTAKPEGEEEAPQGELPSRFRFSDDRDKRVAAIKKAQPNLSWAEAEAIVTGKPAQAEEQEIAETPDDKITALDVEIEGLEDQLREAGENESLYTPEIDGLNKQLRKAVAARTELAITSKLERQAAEKVTKQQQLEASQKYTSLREAARAQAIKEFPDAESAATPLGKAIAARVQELQDPAHPDHPMILASNAAVTIAREEAVKLGINPAAKQVISEPAKPVTAKVPPPVSGSKSTAQSQQTNARPDIHKAIAETDDIETLDAMAGVDRSKPLMSFR